MNKQKTLTPKQLAFCQQVARGKTQSDSYRAAYSAKRMSLNSIHTEASKLMSNPAVAHRVDAIRERIERVTVSAALSDGERVKDKLRTIMDTIEGGPVQMAQLRAAELLGRTVGLFKDVQETVDLRTSADVRAALESRLAAFASTDKDDTGSTNEDDVDQQDSPENGDSAQVSDGPDVGDSPDVVRIH